MQKPRDQLSKRILFELFDPLGQVVLEKEVPSLDSQHMDLCLESRQQDQPRAPLFPLWIITPGRPVGYFRRRGVPSCCACWAHGRSGRPPSPN